MWLLKVISKSGEDNSVPNKIMIIYILNKIDNKFVHLSVYMILWNIIFSDSNESDSIQLIIVK